MCIGYFDAEKMGTRAPHEIDSIMVQCQPHLDRLYASGRVLCDVGISEGARSLKRVNASLKISDAPARESVETIGGVTLIEARDIEEAIKLASLHPATQLPVGEELGFRMEVRPVNYFKSPGEIVK